MSEDVGSTAILPQNFPRLEQLFEILNCHMVAETVATLHLTTKLPPVAALGQSCVQNQPEIEPDWPPKGRDLAPHVICSSLIYLHTSPRETLCMYCTISIGDFCAEV